MSLCFSNIIHLFFVAFIDQPSSSTPLQPSLALDRQLAIEGASNILTQDTQVNGPLPEAPVIPNSQLSTAMGDNASWDKEECPESPSTPAPIDHEGGSPMPSTPFPTSEHFELPSTPAPMDHEHGSPMPSTPAPIDQEGGSPMPSTPSLPTSEHFELPTTPAPMDHDGGSQTPSTPLPTSEHFELPSTPAPMDHDGGYPTPSTPLPTSKDLFISTDHSPSPSIDLPETASSNRRGSSLLAASESHANPVHNRQGEGSLETSLASLINATFQSHLISSPHLGTVNPSHLSLPLSLLGAGNHLGEEDITMDDLTSPLSSIGDEDSGGLTVTFFLHL